MAAVEAAQGGGRPTIPTVAERVWRAFWALDARRTGNGFGPNAISHQEVAQYGRLRGFTFRRWELDALDAMEQARLSSWGDEQPAKEVASRPLSAGLFDAVFG